MSLYIDGFSNESSALSKKASRERPEYWIIFSPWWLMIELPFASVCPCIHGRVFWPPESPPRTPRQSAWRSRSNPSCCLLHPCKTPNNNRTTSVTICHVLINDFSKKKFPQFSSHNGKCHRRQPPTKWGQSPVPWGTELYDAVTNWPWYFMFVSVPDRSWVLTAPADSTAPSTWPFVWPRRWVHCPCWTTDECPGAVRTPPPESVDYPAANEEKRKEKCLKRSVTHTRNHPTPFPRRDGLGFSPKAVKLLLIFGTIPLIGIVFSRTPSTFGVVNSQVWTLLLGLSFLAPHQHLELSTGRCGPSYWDCLFSYPINTWSCKQAGVDPLIGVIFSRTPSTLGVVNSQFWTLLLGLSFLVPHQHLEL